MVGKVISKNEGVSDGGSILKVGFSELPSESDIRRDWSELKKPVVTICCIAFNQEGYIEKALQGILIQKTDFPFEILVHDDASTDNTVEIIKKYVARYPNIIRCIFQSENQFRRGGGGLVISQIFSQTLGEYVTICEGDDYWTSSNKLKLQFEFMNDYPEIKMSFHPVHVLKEVSRKKINSTLGFYGDSIAQLTQVDVIRAGGGFCSSNSVMIRSEVIKNLPEWVYKVTTTDYFWKIIGAKNGVLYIPETMAVYRVHSNGSFTSMNESSMSMFVGTCLGVVGGLFYFSFSPHASGVAARLEAWIGIFKRLVSIAKRVVIEVVRR